MGKKIIAVLLVAAMLTMDIPSKLMPGTISVQAAETGTIEAKETETEEIQGKAGQAAEQESEKNETVQTENEQTEEEQAMEETSKHIKQVSEPIGLEGTHILVHKGGYKLSFILEGTESDAVQLTEFCKQKDFLLDFIPVGFKLIDVCETLAELDRLFRRNRAINSSLYFCYRSFASYL